MRVAFLALAASGAFACASAPTPGSLTTTAEATGYLETGHYAEAVTLCRDFARTYREASCLEVGTSLEGRPIVALAIARAASLPTIYLQAGIHAGEIEGKDAGFAFLRDLLDGKVAAGALDAVAIVFVPVMNPDGHERRSPNNRPNQRGPQEMGFRTNAARQNLNRDFLKADAPETQAVLRVIEKYDPVLMVDLHTTDGAKFEHDVSLNVLPIAPRGDGLERTAAALSTRVLARTTALGHLPIDFYPSFVDEERPHSGFARGEPPARFGTSYMAARGRLALLVETHSWRTYRERAASTYHTLQAVFEEATHEAGAWRNATRAADIANAAVAGTHVTMTYQNGPGSHDIDFRGYAYERRLSELTGGVWLVYDEARPEVWRVPLYDEQVPGIVVDAPTGGYIIDGGFATAVKTVLDRHGIQSFRIADAPDVNVPVEVFRPTATRFLPPFEGRTRVELEGAWTAESRVLDRGALFVPIARPRARLVLHLLEPLLPDSLAQWGMFNAVFERKEYLEPYVLERAARDMLQARPALQAELDAAIDADPSLADPMRKLDWFYRRHPAWDERVDLLPVYRTSQRPGGAFKLGAAADVDR